MSCLFIFGLNNLFLINFGAESVVPFFLLLLLKTEAMAIWRFGRAFAVVERQSTCGSKTAEMQVSQPMNEARVTTRAFIVRPSCCNPKNFLVEFNFTIPFSEIQLNISQIHQSLILCQ